MANPIPNEIGTALQLKDLQDPVVEKNFQQKSVELAPTPDGSYTRVLIDRSSVIGSGVLFGHEAGPIGAETIVEEDALVLGYLYSRIHLKRGAEIGTKACLGSFGAPESLGKIIVGEGAKIGATVRIFSPEVGDTTTIGAGVQIGRGSRIGHDVKPVAGKNSTKEAFGKQVRIGEDTILGNGTIIEHGVTVGREVEIEEGYILSSGLVIPDGAKIFRHLGAQPVRLTQEWLENLATPTSLN